MTLTSCRQLTAFLLLVLVLLAPYNAIAHDLAMMETYACQVLQGECTNNGNGHSETSPCNETQESCEHEECGQDSMESPHGTKVNASFSRKHQFPSDAANLLPEVFLAIFVPPES